MRLTMPCRPGWTAWRTRADNAIQALPNADGTPHLHAAASRARRRIPSLGPWPQWMRSSELSEPSPNFEPSLSKGTYTFRCMHVYAMTTIRLSSEQKETVRKASEVLEKTLGRRLSQGEAVAALAEFALWNRAALANAFASEAPDLTKDPFYDTSLVFDAGPTDARSIDRLLYGPR